MKEHLVIVLLPLIFANCLHMLVVKRNLFPSLQIPLSVRLVRGKQNPAGLPFIAHFERRHIYRRWQFSSIFCCSKIPFSRVLYWVSVIWFLNCPTLF